MSCTGMVSMKCHILSKILNEISKNKNQLNLDQLDQRINLISVSLGWPCSLFGHWLAHFQVSLYKQWVASNKFGQSINQQINPLVNADRTPMNYVILNTQQQIVSSDLKAKSSPLQSSRCSRKQYTHIQFHFNTLCLGSQLLGNSLFLMWLKLTVFIINE